MKMMAADRELVGSVSSDDDAPEEINFEQSKNQARSQRMKERASERQQKEEVKKKRRDIDARNIAQKRSAIVALPEALLRDVAAESDAKKRRELEKELEQQQREAADRERKQEKRNRRRTKVEVGEKTYEFMPLAGVRKIPNKLIFKNKTKAVELDFKERSLYNKKRVKRERVGAAMAKMQKRAQR